MSGPTEMFDINGVLPPVRLGEDGSSEHRSPYPLSMLDFCQLFGFTRERRLMLRGFLGLRGALRDAGLGEGFHWVDGSFVEHVEHLRERAPGDIDVVTFAPLGDRANQARLLSEHPTLFRQGGCKQTYHVDHFLIPSDRALDLRYARNIAYWYSLWSHQRDTGRWKGFVTIPMTDDLEAQSWLDAKDGGGE